MPLLVATKNKAKIKTYINILQQYKIPCVTLDSLDDNSDVEETGKTLRENAVLKASFFAKKYGFPAIGDDTGFEIDALGGEPGIYARRWPGYEATDEELLNMVETKLAGVPEDKRTARLINYIALVDKNGEILQVGTGSIEGYIPVKISDKRDPGFPYRSALFLPQFHKFLIEATGEEINQLKYREESLKKMIPQIKQVISNL